MTETVFFRLLKEDDKEAVLERAIDALRGNEPHPTVHPVAQETFRMIPGSPFAYWVSDQMRGKFGEKSPLEGSERRVRVGLKTSDDFRFLRLWWECPLTASFPTEASNRWVPFAKGGDFSPYYADIPLCINWDENGAEIKEWANPLYGNSGWSRIIKSTDFYFRPGLTWPRRTTSGLSLRALPAGCIFADKGPALLAPPEKLGFLLGLTNSSIFEFFVTLSLGAADTAARSYEVGVLQRVPIPSALPEGIAHVEKPAITIHDIKRSFDRTNEPSHVLTLPTLVAAPGSESGLASRFSSWAALVSSSARQIESAQREIDEICYRLYGISEGDWKTIEAELGTEVKGLPEPGTLTGAAADLVSWAVGVVMGRFDIRLATGERQIPELPDPFAPLPEFSPGMLPEGRVPAGYPIRIDEDGILVNDEGNPDDLVIRAREVFHLVFGSSTDAIEQEACTILGVKSLRDYFTRTGKGGFWDEHVSRYSKSRRKAPVYWLLQSPCGLYQAWVYLHRLNKDSLFKLFGTTYLGGKIEQTKQEIGDLRPGGTLRPGLSRKDEKRLEDLETLLIDLEAFREKLKAITSATNERGQTVGYAPNLDDGVVLSAAPLFEVIPWPVKKKLRGKPVSELELYWEELRAGKYDWAHIAMLYWPDRVTAKCKTDKSLAIAHDLDGQFFPGLRDELRRQAENAVDEPSLEAEDEDEEGSDA